MTNGLYIDGNDIEGDEQELTIFKSQVHISLNSSHQTSPHPNPPKKKNL